MKTKILCACLIIGVLVIGCKANEKPANTHENPTSTAKLSIMPTSTLQFAPTQPHISPTISKTQTLTVTPTKTSTVTPTSTATIPPEARMNFQCLKVEPTLPIGATSRGVTVLENLDKLNTLLLDMATGKTTQISMADENQVGHIVSPDKKLVAYESVLLSSDRSKIIQDELVIATADGQKQKAIPWEKGWVAIPGWLDNQRLIINISGLDPEENVSKKPATMLVLNPFNGERQILKADFPGFLDTPSTVLPYWDGWSGVVYNPTLTRAVYPRFIGDNEDMYTYAIWNLLNQSLVASLEDIFSTQSIYNDIFPMPRWSPDGSQFVFTGRVHFSGYVKSDLFRVGQDGKVDQLTHLGSFAHILDMNYSWSPDGRYIAMFLSTQDVKYPKALVVVLDMVTLDVINYCIPISYDNAGNGTGTQPLSPIWSPDSRQFLVVDWYQKNHNRIILVDIIRGFAAQVAEGMEPRGWMLSP